MLLILFITPLFAASTPPDPPGRVNRQHQDRVPVEELQKGQQKSYNFGERRQVLTELPELVVEFGDNGAPITSRNSSASVYRQQRGAVVYRMSPVDARDAAARTGAKRSKVYIDRGGNMMALPGNIIVRREGPCDMAANRQWADDNGLVLVRCLSQRRNMFIVESPAGDATLELAERIATMDGVLSVEPDWWQPMEPR